VRRRGWELIRINNSLARFVHCLYNQKKDMGNTNKHLNPKNVIAVNDPGDETQRNFRYQTAYGVILLVGAATQKLPYKSIYAEHHEDFLCERVDDKFDGYQVKTRKPEEGSWDLADEPLKKSIKRFVELCQKFGEYVEDLKFVSNADYSETSEKNKNETKVRRSPVLFLKHISECDAVGSIRPPFITTFIELKDYCECPEDVLFMVLKKVGLINGPDRNSFDSEIVVTHLPVLKECKALTVSDLTVVRDELIQKVFYASSLKIDDPSKHWTPINGPDENPTILAKRIPVVEVFRSVADVSSTPFRYSDTHHPALKLGSGEGNLYKLRRKMVKGNLVFQVETMERRSISAERRLIEIAHKKPDSIDDLLNQIVSVVKGECDEAYHHASLSGKIIGPQMLDDVYRRLKDKANSTLVYNEPYETLVGVAGLLTGECKVWWSEVFDLEDGTHGT